MIPEGEATQIILCIGAGEVKRFVATLRCRFNRGAVEGVFPLAFRGHALSRLRVEIDDFTNTQHDLNTSFSARGKPNTPSVCHPGS